MDIIIAFLFFLAVTVAIITVVGHVIWLSIAWFFRQFRSDPSSVTEGSKSQPRCQICNSTLRPDATNCSWCGWQKPLGVTLELLRDLAASERQVARFHRSGKIDDATFANLTAQIDAERERLSSRTGPGTTSAAPPPTSQPAPATAKEPTAPPPHPPSVTQPVEGHGTPTTQTPSVVLGSVIATDDEIVIEPVPSFLGPKEQQPPPSSAADIQQPYTRPEYSQPKQPRRSFTEVLNAFMEESNIRWGEIVGGLLIIGCSTALVVSLWSEISQIPVLKFLIFTTVTAALFGVGLYTEHRWKLPTTSRGILTIATLLVPLNFLAIAAVSGGSAPRGVLVVGSELLAPAIFLCLVYFAGKVLTPSWPHLLVAGVLGSSLGQLLVRHFASPDLSPGLLVALGAFPLACYIAAAVWMLKRALADGEISESETIAIFITLGALTFAAALPFGLLLYKTGSVGMTMMYLAPLVSFGGFPLLATGMFLWRRVTKKELVAARTVGTSLAIIGTTVVVSGMILAWPNPASIVPAALFNFAVFTTLAVILELPFAHLPAAFCFGLAYLVMFHVLAGHVAWQNLRVTSLLQLSLSASSGQALVGLFVLFVAATEWLQRRRRALDGRSYLFVACVIAILSLLLVAVANFGVPGDPYEVWLVCAIYAAGAFWIAHRTRLAGFTWIGSALLLCSFFHALGPWLQREFPWQTALLAHSSLCAIAAIISRNLERDERSVLTTPLNYSALLTSFIAVVCLIQARRWETTAMQSTRFFWLAGIWLVLLWLNRNRALFTAFQIALTCALVLAIKAALQQYDWYAYLPHAFLHPWGLQIQGTALVLLSLGWILLRWWSHKLQFVDGGVGTTDETSNRTRDKLKFLGHFRHFLDARWSFDRLVLWFVLGGFMLLAAYGALSGVTRELTAQDVSNPSWDIAGFPHEQALQLGSWILLALLVIAMLASFWQRRRSIYLVGAVASLTAMIPLFAGTWETQIATASAWRWLAALFLVLASLPVWFRERFSSQLKGLGWPQVEISKHELAGRLRILLLILTIAPLLLLTAYPAVRAIYYMPVHGPAAGFFALLEDSFSYGVPLVLVALVIIGYALRERLPSYAFAAVLFLNLTVTVAHLLSVVAVNGSMDRVVLAHTIQLNAIVLALYAIVWLMSLHRWLPRLSEDRAKESKALLTVLIAIAIGTNALLIVPVVSKLIARPEFAGTGTFAAGGVRGWLAFVLTILAAGLFARVYEKRLAPHSFFATLLAASCLVAFSFAAPGSNRWTSYYTFLICLTVTSWLMMLALWLPRFFHTMPVDQRPLVWLRFSERWDADCVRFSTIAGAITVFLGLRRLTDNSSDWWTIAPLLAITSLFATLNWLTLKRAYLYAAGITFIAASMIWAVKYLPSDGDKFVDVHVIAVALSSVLWLVLELRARRLAGKEGSNALSFHNLAALWLLFLFGCIVAVRILMRLDNQPLLSSSNSDWLALGAVVVLLLACVWDHSAKYAVAGLYFAGLLAAGLLLDELNLPPRRLSWAGMIAMAVYTVLAGLLWRSRAKIVELTDRLKIPRRIADSATELKWLTVFNVALATVVVLLAYWIELRFVDWPPRMTAALAVAIQAVTFALMAEGVRRSKWQEAAITALVIGLVFFGWAWLVPGVTGTWLNRAVILMVEMFALTALYGMGLNKALEREPDWTKAAQTCVPWIAGAGVVALLFSLATEIFYQINFGAVRINPLALIAIGLTLVGGIAICVLFALSSKHDPLKLSERGRMNYVYAAEVMLALLFVHIRLTMPWLFSGFFERYWPFVVMAIAYLGVATAESLRRRKLLVLAQPIERTGAFLPLLPVIGFWLAQSRVDYSALLFIVGGLYGLLSILRRSFLFGLFAAIAGNGGLWYLLHRTPDYHFLQHPQLWLIPVAISVLIAAYLNEDDFTEEQMAGVRYLSLVTIYASSTADIFINGVADSPWLPLVLAALSLAGIFCGIIFRIRGFLLLGSVFLLLAIITMIWYASANLGWTWLWYVAGIVTGATIIFMFAVFEKKRSEVLRMVEGLKEWER